jgi:hypothetical protein
MTYEKAVAHPNFPPRCWSAHYILRRFTFGFLGTFFSPGFFHSRQIRSPTRRQRRGQRRYVSYCRRTGSIDGQQCEPPSWSESPLRDIVFLPVGARLPRTCCAACTARSTSASPVCQLQPDTRMQRLPRHVVPRGFSPLSPVSTRGGTLFARVERHTDDRRQRFVAPTWPC